MRYYRKPTFLVLLLFLSYSGYTQQQTKDFDITERSIRYPHYFKEWNIKTSLGFSMVSPPRDLLEDAIQAPLVNLHVVMGLPAHFSLEGDVSSIVVSNQFSLGPRYNLMIKRFSANVGGDIAFSYGFLHQGGFDNSSSVWSLYPEISAGYRIGNINLSLQGQVCVILNSRSNTGENEVSRYKNYFNGGSVGLYIEQRLWKNKVFVIGVRDNYEKFYWPVWMLFTTFDRYYHIPELSFSWVL